MNFLERMKKANELAKTEDKSSVTILKEGDAEFMNVGEAAEAANTLHYYAKLKPADCEMRAAIVGSITRMAKDANGADGPLERYEVIGRDVKTNATLRGWIIKFNDNVRIPEVGDAHKLPAFHLPKGHAMVSWNDSLVVAKADNVYQAVSVLTAEAMSAEQFHFETLRNEIKLAAKEAVGTDA